MIFATCSARSGKTISFFSLEQMFVASLANAPMYAERMRRAGLTERLARRVKAKSEGGDPRMAEYVAKHLFEVKHAKEALRARLRLRALCRDTKDLRNSIKFFVDFAHIMRRGDA